MGRTKAPSAIALNMVKPGLGRGEEGARDGGRKGALSPTRLTHNMSLYKDSYGMSQRFGAGKISLIMCR